MVKRKSCNDDPKILARSVPLPLQIFLWRQTSPFIRPKLGRLYEASCVSFERVLVENKLHGLSPSLSDAINSITRWQLIQASLPHLMHCCAALLSNRAKLGHADKLGVAETKLLLTLHWVLLESLEECLQEDSSQLDFLRLPGNSEHGLTTIQLFVYLFAPLVYSIKESDLTFRLANGLKLWRPLWDHKLPDISSFTAQVKPKRCYRLATRRIWKDPEMTSKVEEEKEEVDEKQEQEQQEQKQEQEEAVGEPPKAEEAPSESPPGVIVPLADISEVSRFSSGAVTPDPPSVNVEIVCEVCSTSVTQNNTCRCGNLKVTGDMAAKTRFDFDQVSSSSSEDETKPLKPSRAKERPKSLIERSILPLHEGIDHAELAASLSVPRPPPPSTSPTDLPKRRLPQRINDVFSATYFDVAVMRCLFIPHWAEEGVQWALMYLLSRLRQIADETMAAERVRQRSNSSPIPQITISLFSPVPGPPKKFSVPMSCMGGSEPSKDEGRHRESYPLVGSPKKMKFERVEPLPLRKISPPKRSSLGDQGRGNKAHRKLRRTSSLSKTVGALMPKLIKEEIEEGKVGSGSDEQIVQTLDASSTKTPTLGEVPKSSSTGTPKLEPFKFKIDVVQLKTVPALMSPEELTKSGSPSTPPLYSTGSLDSKRPFVSTTTTSSSFVSRPTALPYQQSFSATATKLPSFVQVSADAAHKPTVVTTQTRPFGATSKVSPIVIPPIKAEKSSTCFTVTKTTTNVQSSSVMTAKADFFSEHTNSTSTKSEKLYERRAMKSEKNLITLHKPVSVEVQEKPLLIFDEPVTIEPQPAKVVHKANVVQHKAPVVVNRPMLQRQSPVFEAPPQPLDAVPSSDTNVTFEAAKPLVTPILMNNSKSPPTSPEELSPPPEKSPSSVSSSSLLIPVSEDLSEPPPPQSPPSPDKPPQSPSSPDRLTHQDSSSMSRLDIPTFLPRSASDTFVNYHTSEEEEITEAAGSTYYIQEDGQMNYSVIIKALHKIITKETTAKVCDTSLHIIETILEFRVVKQSEKPSQAKIPVIKVEGEKVKAPDKDGDGDVASKSLEDMTVHNLVMETLIQVFRALGCHHGCGEGLRGHSGDKLRLMGQQCLNRMFKIDPSQFRRYLRFMISTHPLENILDFLHALLGFCEDPVRIPHRPGSPFYNAGPSTGPNEGIARGGFATNFGSGVAGTGVRGIEGTIVGSIFKALVTRMANSREELNAPENSALYSDVRQLLHYIREAHGGVFRRVALSGLIDSSGKGQDEKDKDKTGKVGFSETKSDSDKNLPNPPSKDGGEGGDVSPGTRLRRHLFKKKFRSTDCALDDERLAEGAGGKRRFSVFQFAQAVTTWRNRAIRSNLGSEDGPELAEPSETTPRAKKVHMDTGSVYAGRKKVEDHSFFLKFRKKSKRDPSSTEERDDCETPRSMEDEEEMASDSLDMGTEKEKKPVDRVVIAAGMKRLNLLMDCCNPGTVPDAEFLAASLDLNAPVVARAALLLECCHFVYRCNHGDWPEWMKSGRSYQRGRVSSNVMSTRNMGSCYRKNASMQRMASKMFYLWAEAIGARLEEIERQEAKDVTVVIGKVKDESIKRRLRQQDDQEDFLDEATVNPSGTACPHALKMVACQLLCEITAFLRETYQSLPKPRKVDRGGFGRAPTRDSEFLELPSSSAPNMTAVQRQASAGSSVTSSPPPPRHSAPSTVVDSPSGTSERKISFALGGDDDSQHSSNTELNNVDQQVEEKKVTPGRKQSRGGLLRRHPAPSSPAPREQHNHSFRNRHRSRPDSLFGTQPGSQAQPPADTTPHVKFSAESQPTIIGMSHENSAPADEHPVFGLASSFLSSLLGRSGSVKSRKISSISVDDDSTGETSSVFSEQVSPQEPEHVPELASTPDTVGLDDIDLSKNMPWIPIIVEIASKTNFICNHQRCCHPNCFERQKRNCYRLMKAVRYICGEDSILRPRDDDMDERMRRLDGKGKRKESGQGHSTLRSFRELRRESTSSTLDRQVSVFRHQVAASTSRTNSAVALTSGSFPMELEWPKKEDSPQLKYLKTQAMFLWHSPLSLLTKAAPILTEDLFADILTLAWELLLDSSQQLAGSTAAMVLICAVKIPDTVTKLIAGEMHHQEAGQRADAIQRFAVLWRFRHQVWPRMEDKASLIFRVPPPNIDFTVPSPTIGVANIAVIDPPWMPVTTSDLEEKVSTEEETRSFAAVAVSRTTQRREHIKKTLLREQEKKRAARETFHMTNVPILTQAAYEPSHHVTSDDEDDTPMPVTVSMTARRVSIAPPATMAAAAGLNRGRNLSIRRASLWSGGASTGNASGDDEGMVTERTHHSPPTFGVFFPSCVCTTIVHLVALLDDSEVNKEGVAVCEVAEKVLWACLVEEPALICRYILEKITAKNKQEDLILLLKKMVSHYGELPAQTAHCLFNYLLGFVVYHCRAPHEGANEAIANTLSVLWHIIPFVSGISFKDLKQTLKKEQCDPTVLISANVPCAKKLIVHGPNETDIPTQLPISEDMQFEEIHQDCLEFFNIPIQEHCAHFLVDKKTNQMLDVKSYVRDFYAYKRSHCPELILKKIDQLEGLEHLQQQAFTLKIAELGRVYFALATLQSTPSQVMSSHITFLHDELIRLPSFPRKSLDAEFLLYAIPKQGRELFGLDVIHKYMWVKFTAAIFLNMSSDFSWSGDIQLFLNVLNGCLLLHCQDISLLRICLASFINISRHFKQMFATKGFQYIMPTILRVYNYHNSNPLVCRAVEYVCRQFYVLHMKPFVLQLFGSAAPLLQGEEEVNPQKISPRCLFRLLLSMEKDSKDSLDILELVTGEKPLKTLDFCYSNDHLATFTIAEAIRLCAIVVAYAPESVRSAQMLSVLADLVPLYLEHVKEQTKKRDNPSAAKSETAVINSMGVCIKALIIGAETLARSTSGPSRKIENVNATTSFKSSNNSQQSSVHKASRKSAMNAAGADLGEEDMREDFQFRYNDYRVRRRYEDDSEDAEPMNEFCKPRDMLLNVAAGYYCHSLARLKELRPHNESRQHSSSSSLELLDQRCHLRLAEVAHTLLKVAPHDPITMGCKGLQMYITQMIPQTDWTSQDLRPALILILKRLDKLFNKIHKKPTLMRHMDWESAANFLKGIYVTLTRQSIISHLPHLKSLLNICLALLLCDGSASGGGDGLSLLTMSSPTGGMRFTPPPVFCSAVVRAVAMQMHCMKHQYWMRPKDLYTLEQVFGGTPVFNSAERTETILLYLVIPLCLRVGCGRKDSPKIRPSDISFALTMILYALLPPKRQPTMEVGRSGAMPLKQQHHYSSITDLPSHTSISYRDSSSVIPDSLYEAGFLGLKMMMVCFENQLSREWFRIASAIKELGSRMLGGLALWSFMDFVITVRTPLYVMLKPFIAFKMMRMICETDHEVMLQRYVGQKLRVTHSPQTKCKSETMLELVNELRHLRDNMFVPRDRVKFTDELAVMTGQRAQVFEEMEITSPFQQRGSIISRLTRKATITSRRSSSRQSSSRRNSTRRRGSVRSSDSADHNANNSDQQRSLSRSNSGYGRRSIRHTDTCIAEADDEREEEEEMGSPLRPFQRRHNTKRISRSTSSRRHVRPEAHTPEVHAPEENVIHIDPLIEKSDDDIDDGTNEQSRLLQQPTTPRDHHSFSAPIMAPTDTEDDMEGMQETVRLLDMAKTVDPTIVDRRGSTGVHDTCV
ncbi:protein unc-80 homolog isoform X3 [Acanthaster planci]|uniref:Protein unc-80 homolog isoform X3 n=1 Tax=Acanthaster planci TaxID=133434 RepID=A0A8B7ZFA4_ACAPL|nr:protein unc-80 homolog isoform X3 [Acanthaster planci]